MDLCEYNEFVDRSCCVFFVLKLNRLQQNDGDLDRKSLYPCSIVLYLSIQIIFTMKSASFDPLIARFKYVFFNIHDYLFVFFLQRNLKRCRKHCSSVFRLFSFQMTPFASFVTITFDNPVSHSIITFTIYLIDTTSS